MPYYCKCSVRFGLHPTLHICDLSSKPDYIDISLIYRWKFWKQNWDWNKMVHVKWFCSKYRLTMPFRSSVCHQMWLFQYSQNSIVPMFSINNLNNSKNVNVAGFVAKLMSIQFDYIVNTFCAKYWITQRFAFFLDQKLEVFYFY